MEKENQDISKNSTSKFISFWDKLEKNISISLLLAMSAITFLQVITRHLLGFSLKWTEEVARFLLVALTYIGSAYAFKKGIHVRLEALKHFGHLTPATRIPVTIPYMSIPIGSFLIVVRLTVLLIEDLKTGPIAEVEEEKS